jgi:hypothetical protein
MQRLELFLISTCKWVWILHLQKSYLPIKVKNLDNYRFFFRREKWKPQHGSWYERFKANTIMFLRIANSALREIPMFITPDQPLWSKHLNDAVAVVVDPQMYMNLKFYIYENVYVNEFDYYSTFTFIERFHFRKCRSQIHIHLSIKNNSNCFI